MEQRDAASQLLHKASIVFDAPRADVMFDTLPADMLRWGGLGVYSDDRGHVANASASAIPSPDTSGISVKSQMDPNTSS